MLAAFRILLRRQEDGTLAWYNGFGTVLETWNERGAALMNATYEMSNSVGRNIPQIGRSKAHWRNLYQLIRSRFTKTVF